MLEKLKLHLETAQYPWTHEPFSDAKLSKALLSRKPKLTLRFWRKGIVETAVISDFSCEIKITKTEKS